MNRQGSSTTYIENRYLYIAHIVTSYQRFEMRYKNRCFSVLPFLALGVLVMGRSAEGDVVKEVSTKQEGVVANISRDEVKVEDMEMAEEEQEVVASELLGDLRLELGRKLLLQGGLEVELGQILVGVRESENLRIARFFTRKFSG